MLLYLNERKYLLASIIAIILDGLIGYFISGYFNKINFFYPMLTIVLIPFICLSNKNKSYYLISIIGIIYDLLYSSVFLYNFIIFIILVNFNMKIARYFKNSLWLLIMLALFNILFYDTIGFILVLLTNYNEVTFNDLIYKFDHSLLLNILSVFVFWFLFKKDLFHS